MGVMSGLAATNGRLRYYVIRAIAGGLSRRVRGGNRPGHCSEARLFGSEEKMAFFSKPPCPGRAPVSATVTEARRRVDTARACPQPLRS